MGHCDGFISQAAKDARASQDTLIDLFGRIEMFFRRLEIYTEVPLTMEMKDMVVEIMVEVLAILGIATKEIKQGKMSRYLLYCTNIEYWLKDVLEKYLKNLMGRTEMEDALKKLDKLTQEEARMAAAENLKATYSVDKRVQGVADTVVAVDNRVARVDDRVASVGDQVADVNDQVAGVSNQVSSVDDRVASVNDRVVTVDDRVKVVDNRVVEVIAGV